MKTKKEIIEVLGLHYEKQDYKNGNVKLVKTDELKENSDEWFDKLYAEATAELEGKTND